MAVSTMLDHSPTLLCGEAQERSHTHKHQLVSRFSSSPHPPPSTSRDARMCTHVSKTGTGREFPTIIFNTSPRISSTLLMMAGTGASAHAAVNWHTYLHQSTRRGATPHTKRQTHNQFFDRARLPQLTRTTNKQTTQNQDKREHDAPPPQEKHTPELHHDVEVLFTWVPRPTCKLDHDVSRVVAVGVVRVLPQHPQRPVPCLAQPTLQGLGCVVLGHTRGGRHCGRGAASHHGRQEGERGVHIQALCTRPKQQQHKTCRRQ